MQNKAKSRGFSMFDIFKAPKSCEGVLRILVTYTSDRSDSDVDCPDSKEKLGAHQRRI